MCISSFSIKSFLKKNNMNMCTQYACVHTGLGAHVRSEDNFVKLILFYHGLCRFGDQIQVVQFM